MSQPRFRLFAGPNGSGKTFFFKHLKSRGLITTEIYVSADKIEADIKKRSVFNFNAYRVKVTEAEFKQHIYQRVFLQANLMTHPFLKL